jgi:hypothetical protein
MRLPLLFAAALLSIAATPPPPSALNPYIKDGRFDPGDYGWMRGRFVDASPADKAVMADIQRWLGACYASGQAETRGELQALGIVEPKLDRMDFRDGLCSQVAMMPDTTQKTSFAAFEQALRTARPIAETYLMAVRVAEGSDLREPNLRALLQSRPLGEQMLRKGANWGQGETADAPRLGPTEQAIVVARIGMAASVRDRANIVWLKALVDEVGWPRISEVGELASTQAWLLVQHADADPAFQLRALRLMEKLLPAGEVSKRNYAYLYDRIMLKLNGRQRYATQMTCEGRRRLPLPLEDPGAVERLRKEAGMEPVAEYLAFIQKNVGDCPPDPTPR